MPAPFIYNPDIPQPTDQPSQSQGQILDNFTSINEIWDVNHYTFASANGGKHKFLQLPIQIAAPATGVNEFGMYTASYTPEGGGTAVTNLVIKKPDTGQRIPFTASGGNEGNGYSWLASGLLMKWGISSITSPPYTDPLPRDPQDILYPTSVNTPVFNAAAYAITITNRSNNYGGILDPDTFVYLHGQGNFDYFQIKMFRRVANGGQAVPALSFSWVAIGPATANGL